MNEVRVMAENDEISFTLPGLQGPGISAQGMMDNIDFVAKSKGLAITHKWMYHCTNADAFISMIQSKEM